MGGIYFHRDLLADGYRVEPTFPTKPPLRHKMDK